MAVYLSADVGVIQDATIAHHGAGDAAGAPWRQAGQEQLLLGHGWEAGHHLLHHWDKRTGSIQSIVRGRLPPSSPRPGGPQEGGRLEGGSPRPCAQAWGAHSSPPRVRTHSQD